MTQQLNLIEGILRKFIFSLVTCLFTLNSVLASESRPAPVTIIALGDSLTDGYGLDKSLAYPKRLEEKFHADGMTHVKILNAGISGSTSSGAEKRLNWFLKTKPQILLLALGANDGLRGVPVETTKQNLKKTIQVAKQHNLKVVLAGMMMPPNYGKEYTEKFKQMFQDLAAEEKVELIPFLLKDVAGHRDLNLEDGLHPNEKGHKRIAETVYAHLKPLVVALNAEKPNNTKINK